MARSKRTPSSSEALSHRHWFELTLLLLGASSVLLLMSLISYNPLDQGFFHEGSIEVKNMAGSFGAELADILLTLFGFWSYTMPFLMLLIGWQMTRQSQRLGFLQQLTFVVGVLLLLTALFSLLHLLGQSLTQNLPFLPAGYLGSMLASAFVLKFNQVGAIWLSFTLLFAALSLLTKLSWPRLLHQFLSLARASLKRCVSFAQRLWQGKPEPRVANVSIDKTTPKRITRGTHDKVTSAESIAHTEDDEAIQSLLSRPSTAQVADAVQQQLEPQSNSLSTSQYDLPKLSLLDVANGKKTKKLTAAQVEAISRSVEAHLLDFGIKADVVGMFPGPVVTCFELQLAAGTKVSKVSGLAKDLARSLSVVSVRVVEVLPGKPYIGLEIPNDTREMVMLSDIIGSKEFINQSMALPLALGKDIAGKPIVADLAKMPHCLVAGTTGSGKSVGINAMLLGLLYDATPEDLRMILIDPKMLELSIYDGIPHLLTPVVTDMKDAGRALSWCVYEMERRYKLMAALGVRNVAGYNTMLQTRQDQGNPVPDPFWKGGEDQEPPLLEKLPSIVVCADEFADMIMVVGKKVEEQITRLAQKARAAGIHLILATQRPSVDVITGLIKANIPTRIAFQVSSKIDSRTVLDQQGAEQLLGQGDMLYLAPGTGVPIRVHGAYVGDEELHRITKAIKSQGQPNYLKEITDESMDSSEGSESIDAAGDDKDALFEQAVKIVLETKRASISNIQRRLKIGYNRAARIVDQMEAAGIVSPMDANGSRTLMANQFEGQS